MAVIGHWVVAFLAGWAVPQASVAFLCKLTMMSDALAGVLMLCGLERGGIYAAWLMSTPPPGTQGLVEYWKHTGRWAPGVDLVAGEDNFRGFGVLFPFYTDISYSHSVELMAILAVFLIALLVLRSRISIPYAAVIFLSLVSHPLLDMLFHDAYFLMGDRTATRVSVGLWQIDSIGPLLFFAEILMAYLPYRLWLSGREPVSTDEKVKEDMAQYKRKFWMIGVGHNLASWYIMGPLFQWGFYRFTTLQFGADNWWSYAIMAVMLFSWTSALYPLHKLDGLLVSKAAPAEEAPYLKV